MNACFNWEQEVGVSFVVRLGGFFRRPFSDHLFFLSSPFSFSRFFFPGTSSTYFPREPSPAFFFQGPSSCFFFMGPEWRREKGGGMEEDKGGRRVGKDRVRKKKFSRIWGR